MSRFKPKLLPIALCGLFVAGSPQAQDLQVAELGDCTLASGAILHDCRVAYRDFRPAAGEEAQTLVFPTWFGGSSGDLVQSGHIGPGLLADTSAYRVIAIDAFANGESSSPSNSPRQGGETFPALTIGDMVIAQHRLLTEVLGLDSVYAVMGISMGGMQTFEWMARFPDFADRYVPIEGTPWPGPQDILLWGGWVDILGEYDGSEESLQDTREDFGRLMAMTLWTPDYLARTLEPEAVPGFLEGFTPQWGASGVWDHRAQAQAMLTQDVPLERLPEPRPRALVVVSRTDMVVTPGPSLELAEAAGMPSLVLEGDCGHLANTAACQGDAVIASVHAFLEAE